MGADCGIDELDNSAREATAQLEKSPLLTLNVIHPPPQCQISIRAADTVSSAPRSVCALPSGSASHCLRLTLHLHFLVWPDHITPHVCPSHCICIS